VFVRCKVFDPDHEGCIYTFVKRVIKRRDVTVYEDHESETDYSKVITVTFGTTLPYLH
jgi:hypothetical protein